MYLTIHYLFEYYICCIQVTWMLLNAQKANILKWIYTTDVILTLSSCNIKTNSSKQANTWLFLSIPVCLKCIDMCKLSYSCTIQHARTFLLQCLYFLWNIHIYIIIYIYIYIIRIPSIIQPCSCWAIEI